MDAISNSANLVLSLHQSPRTMCLHSWLNGNGCLSGYNHKTDAGVSYVMSCHVIMALL